MENLVMNIAVKHKTPKNVVVKLDALQFERLASLFGFFNQAFLDSLERAEKDYKTGKFRKVRSLKELRA